MGIYYFAVDYQNELQMWPPKKDSPKKFGIINPYGCFANMVAMKNIYGYNFVFVNDVNTIEEHEFKDVSEDVFEEYCKEFPFILEDKNFYGDVKKNE